MTALTCYGITTASSTLSTAYELITAGGGSQATGTGKSTSVSNHTGWGEIYSQGTSNTWGSAGSQGSPSGNGWFLDSATLNLAGNTIASGTYTSAFNLYISASSITADIAIRIYKYNGGTYTLIASDTFSGQSITGTVTQYNQTTNSAGSIAMSSGDVLYVDLWLHITAGGSIASSVRYFPSNSQTAGWSGCSIATPGYSSTGGGTTHFLICDGYGGCFS